MQKLTKEMQIDILTYSYFFKTLKRFKQLESSFKFRPQYAALYKQFMTEYINLNHMEKIGKYQPHNYP